MVFEPSKYLTKLPKRRKIRAGSIHPETGKKVHEDMWVTTEADYLEVVHRIQWFRNDHPADSGWGIQTVEQEHHPPTENSPGYARIKARIVDPDGRIIAEGTRTCWSHQFQDYYEKAETQAIGRALAAAGWGTAFAAADFDEGDAVADAPVERDNQPNEPPTEAPQKLPPLPEPVDRGKNASDGVTSQRKGMYGESSRRTISQKQADRLAAICRNEGKRSLWELSLYLRAEYDVQKREHVPVSEYDSIVEWARHPGSNERIGSDIADWLTTLANRVMPDPVEWEAVLDCIDKAPFDPVEDWTWMEAATVFAALVKKENQ